MLGKWEESVRSKIGNFNQKLTLAIPVFGEISLSLSLTHTLMRAHTLTLYFLIYFC